MKERERILELVKEGVISTEEALVLLENSAHKEGKAAVKKEQANIQKPILKKAPVAPIPEIKEEKSAEPVLSDIEDAAEEGEARLEQEQNQDRERLEAILEELANEASGYSAKLDETNKVIDDLKEQINAKKEVQMVFETKEELDELSAEEEAEVNILENEIDALEDEVAILEDEKEELEEKLKTVKKQQWGTIKKILQKNLKFLMIGKKRPLKR